MKYKGRGKTSARSHGVKVIKRKRKCDSTCALWDYCATNIKEYFADHCPVKKICSPKLKCFETCQYEKSHPGFRRPCRVQYDHQMPHALIAEESRRTYDYFLGGKKK